jgi:hypothetical protein
MELSGQEISDRQARIPRRPVFPRSHADYRRAAFWWELEALRGHKSAEDSRRYARNMRWAAELTTVYGPGTWLELSARRKAASETAPMHHPALHEVAP